MINRTQAADGGSGGIATIRHQRPSAGFAQHDVAPQNITAVARPLHGGKADGYLAVAVRNRRGSQGESDSIPDVLTTSSHTRRTWQPNRTTTTAPLSKGNTSRSSDGASGNGSGNRRRRLVKTAPPFIPSLPSRSVASAKDDGQNDIDEGTTKPPMTIAALALVAADVRQQLGQPEYVAIAARQAAAEQHWNDTHNCDTVIHELHQQLGIIPKDEGNSSSKRSAGNTPGNGKSTAPLSHLVAQTKRRVVSVRRGEMAAWVARIRRIIAEAHIGPRANDIEIVLLPDPLGIVVPPHAGSGAPPPADFCIEFASTASIEECLGPVLRTLMQKRLATPSTAEAEDSDDANTNPRPGEGALALHDYPYNLGIHCFRVEVLPLPPRKVSIHVSLLPAVRDRFFLTNASRLGRIFSLAIDPPFPSQLVDWTDAHRARLLYLVLDDLLHGGQHPPVSAKEEAVLLFPAHVDDIRDSIWRDAMTPSSAAGWLHVSEDSIVSYFGEEVLFYYAWMNHYIKWLLAAALLSGAVSMATLLTPQTAPVSFTAAEEEEERLWMQASLLSYFVPQAARRFVDVAMIPLFSLAMILGSVLCIKLWERRCSLLQMRYHLFQQEAEDEPRRSFRGSPGVDPVTGAPQLQYPAWYRAVVLQPLSWFFIALFVLLTLLLMICSLNLDGMVTDSGSIAAIPWLAKYAASGGVFDAAYHPWLSLIPGIAYACCISIFSSVFKQLAEALTKMENYRRRGEHARSLTQKRVVFEFINSYGKLFFIAFGRRNMAELTTSLRYIFLTSVLTRLLTGTVLPFLVTHRSVVLHRLFSTGSRHDTSKTEKGDAAVDRDRKYSNSSNPPRANGTGAAPASSTAVVMAPPSDRNNSRGGGAASALDEADELLDDYDVYSDFIEMVVQFGYLLLFAVAYPTASIVALLSNLVELRSDLFKMCYVVRRPVPRLGLKEMKTWNGVLRCLAVLSVITNTLLLVFTSQQMAKWLPEYFDDTTSGDAPVEMLTALPRHGSDAAGLAHAVIPGKGRCVVLSGMVVEHLVGAVAVFLLWRIDSQPSIVRRYRRQKEYDRMTRR